MDADKLAEWHARNLEEAAKYNFFLRKKHQTQADFIRKQAKRIPELESIIEDWMRVAREQAEQIEKLEAETEANDGR